jgi:hypothetical protein
MLTQPVTIQVIDLIRQLPPRDRLHVVSQILPELERELPAGPKPRRSLRGLCADLGSAPFMNVPVISRDCEIRLLSLATIW